MTRTAGSVGPGVASNAVERAAKDDLRDSAPDGLLGPALYLLRTPRSGSDRPPAAILTISPPQRSRPRARGLPTAGPRPCGPRPPPSASTCGAPPVRHGAAGGA